MSDTVIRNKGMKILIEHLGKAEALLPDQLTADQLTNIYAASMAYE